MTAPSSAKALADHLMAADRVAVFTGAGISTESGIPDFRSPGGVWSKMQPIYFQDFVSSREARRESWTRVFNRTAGWTGAAPNTGHRAIASLFHAGKVSAVVTQNVDNLHQDSGIDPEKVIEIHGNASYAKCLECGARYTFDALRPRFEAGEDLTCEQADCDGLLKSATISFGQSMPEDEMKRAEVEMLQADAVLVLGSSLQVFPAANLPLIALQNGAKMLIVNREPTDFDSYATLSLQEELGPCLTQALGHMGLSVEH